jgi:hypothetical protein
LAAPVVVDSSANVIPRESFEAKKRRLCGNSEDHKPIERLPRNVSQKPLGGLESNRHDVKRSPASPGQ